MEKYGKDTKLETPKLIKNFYQLHETIKNRPQAEVDKFLEEHEITTEGTDIPRPVTNF